MHLIIEMGGTKINFFVIEKAGSHSKLSIPTTNPNDFKEYVVKKFRGKLISKIVLACFGPISFDGPNYGEILMTPKKFWQHTNIYQWLKHSICREITLVTDVTLPALGAMEKYNLEENFFTYVTIGTGIGGCNVYKGTILQNEMHPEIGHMYLGYSEEKFCEYHPHCFENQSSGHYFSRKHNIKFKDIDDSHVGWSEMTNKLSILIYNLYAALGVEYIVLGGGLIREDMRHQLLSDLEKINNSYLPILAKKDFDKRLILDSSSDDLSFLGGIYALNGDI